MLVAETGHLQRVGHAAAGFLGERLDHRIAVVVSHQHRILRLQLGGDGGAIIGLFLRAQLLGLLGGKMRLDQKAFRYLRHVY
ncbi:hypothetical protein D9M71_237910 [compost metagenome]